MAQLNLPFGVRVANNDPLDADRYIAPDISTRDLLITNGRAYVGLQVYVSGTTNKLYILKDMTPTWEEVGGAADIHGTRKILWIGCRILKLINFDSSVYNILI
jgi:hypothetical protein